MGKLKLDWTREMRISRTKLDSLPILDCTDSHRVELLRSILGVRHAISGLLAVETRDISPAEVALEQAWQEALDPALVELYWHPFRNGLSEAPEDEEELRRWIRRRISGGEAVDRLRSMLNRFMIRGANVGGRLSLQDMGVGGHFSLSDREYLAQLSATAQNLTTIDSEMSLINTTVDDLVRGVPQARKDEDNTLKVMGALIGGWALYRSMSISVTESSRAIVAGSVWAYLRNDVKLIEYFAVQDELTCVYCSPLNGLVVPVNDIPSQAVIPIHPYCRCRWKGKLDGWKTPGHIWRG